jgi:hypothetical protein
VLLERDSDRFGVVLLGYSRWQKETYGSRPKNFPYLFSANDILNQPMVEIILEVMTTTDHEMNLMV